MATDFLDIGGFLSSTANSASSWVYPVIWTAILIVLGVFAWWYLQHRHRVSLRLLTSYGSVPFNDKAREIKVDNVLFWKLLKRKDIIPIPPKKSLNSIGRDLFGKQKWNAELYWSEEDGYIPIYDSVNKDNLHDKIRILESNDSGEEIFVDKPFLPFTPQQRALFIGQLRKAEQMRKKTLWEVLQNIAVPMTLALIVVMMLVFWEDIAKPAQEMGSLNVQMQEQNKVLLAQISDISGQNAQIVKVLKDDTTSRDLQIQQILDREGSRT